MAKKKQMHSVETVRALLDYDAETGKFTWKERPRGMFPAERFWITWNKRFNGKPALCTLAHNGYLYGAIFGENWSAHRMAWFLSTGEEPDEVDHINGDRTDNRLVNLRNVNRQVNCQNTAKATRNTSGVVGVRWHRSGRGWTVSIGHEYVGFYKDFERAVAARKAAEAQKGFHPNHGREAALSQEA